MMLSLENVKKSFVEPGGGRLPILDVRRFDVAAGEQMVLIGRSGSGKTTLLHLIAGISRPDEGTIHIDGINIVRLPEAACDRFRADKLGYVFQTFNLLPGFTALENVLLGNVVCHRARQAGASTAPTGARRPGAPPAAQTGATFRRRTTARGRRARAWRTSRSCCWQTSQRPTSIRDISKQVVDLIRETCREENVALVLGDAHVGSGEAV